MEEYEGDEMQIVVPPSRLQIWDNRHILVTHDECVFYSNDAKKSMWLEENEGIIRKKGQGGSIMVSEFLCSCHGRLRLDPATAEQLGLPAEAREIIKPGKNADGYWTSEQMVKQLTEKALPIFNALHPGCIGGYAKSFLKAQLIPLSNIRPLYTQAYFVSTNPQTTMRTPPIHFWSVV